MSIFTDERTLWADDQDKLSVLLENKSRDAINDLLEDYKYLLVKDNKQDKSAKLRVIQILTLPVIPLLIVLMPIKWILTGDKYLDSWMKWVKLNTKYFL